MWSKINFVIILIIQNVDCKIREETKTESQLPDIYQEYFSRKTTLAITTDEDEIKWSISNESTTMIIVDHLKIEEMLPDIQIKINHFIISYTDIEDFNTTLEQLKNSYCFDSRLQFLILGKAFEDLDSLAEVLWEFRLYKSAILLNEKFYQIDFKHIDCGSNVKSRKIKRKPSLFEPDMKKYFRGCSLRIIFSYLKPWMNKLDQQEKDPGIFARIMELFSNTHQIKMLYLPEDPQYTLELQESYSYESARNDLQSGYADVFLGMGNNLQTGMEYTKMICENNLHWLVPKPRSLPVWKALLKFLSPVQWLVLLAIAALFCVIFTVIAYLTKADKQVKKLFTNYLNIYAIFIGSSNAHFGPLNTPLKMVVLTCSFWSFLISVILQAKLFSVMRNPMYENDITNQDKLLDSGLPMKFNMAVGLIFLVTGSQNQRVFDTFIALDEDILEGMQKLNKTMDFATIVDDGIVIMYPDLREKFNIFRIVPFQVSLYMTKFHHLFECFNNAIVKFVEGGLIDKLISDASFRYSLQNGFGFHNEPKEQHQQYGMGHVWGAFLILLHGIWFSTVVFFLELMLPRAKSKTESVIRKLKNRK